MKEGVGNPNLFVLLASVSSEIGGWNKSTWAMYVGNGCVVKTTTQQYNDNGTYSISEALTYVPGVCIEHDVNGDIKLSSYEDFS